MRKEGFFDWLDDASSSRNSIFTSDRGWKLSKFVSQRTFDKYFRSSFARFVTLSLHYLHSFLRTSDCNQFANKTRRGKIVESTQQVLTNLPFHAELRSLQVNEHFPRGYQRQRGERRRQNLLSRVFRNAVNNKPLSAIVSFFYLEYKKLQHGGERQFRVSRETMLVRLFHCRLARVRERETNPAWIPGVR